MAKMVSIRGDRLGARHLPARGGISLRRAVSIRFTSVRREPFRSGFPVPAGINLCELFRKPVTPACGMRRSYDPACEKLSCVSLDGESALPDRRRTAGAGRRRGDDDERGRKLESTS